MGRLTGWIANRSFISVLLYWLRDPSYFRNFKMRLWFGAILISSPKTSLDFVILKLDFDMAEFWYIQCVDSPLLTAGDRIRGSDRDNTGINDRKQLSYRIDPTLPQTIISQFLVWKLFRCDTGQACSSQILNLWMGRRQCCLCDTPLWLKVSQWVLYFPISAFLYLGGVIFKPLYPKPIPSYSYLINDDIKMCWCKRFD